MKDNATMKLKGSSLSVINKNVSVSQYLKEKKLALGQWMGARKIVYLDTKFWLILRDVSLNRESGTDSREFYEKVITLVRSQICTFPISEDVFLEVIRQSDPNTLSETVKLIDLLSANVSMISLEERLSLEYKHFIEHISDEGLYECSALAWTKLVYTLGFVTPEIQGEAGELIQKKFIDHMWSIPMSKVIDILQKSGDVSPITMRFDAENLNSGKFSHTHQNNSFKKMFLSELAGALEVYEGVFLDSIREMFESKVGMPINQADIINHDCSNLIIKAIYNVFKLNKDKNHLPTLRIISGLHAAVRWDKSQKFQENDYHDFRHAASAIPYCDCFFTEKRLAHLVTQKITGYDKQYNCNVQSSVKGVNKVLSEFLMLV